MSSSDSEKMKDRIVEENKPQFDKAFSDKSNSFEIGEKNKYESLETENIILNEDNSQINKDNSGIVAEDENLQLEKSKGTSTSLSIVEEGALKDYLKDSDGTLKPNPPISTSDGNTPNNSAIFEENDVSEEDKSHLNKDKKDLNMIEVPPPVVTKDFMMYGQIDKLTSVVVKFLNENYCIFIRSEDVIKTNEYKCSCVVKSDKNQGMKINCLSISNLDERKKNNYLRYCEKVQSKNFSFIVNYSFNNVYDYCLITVAKNYPSTLYDSVNGKSSKNNYIVQLNSMLKKMHYNELTHSNLTPKNIFVDENGSLCLGGYGQQLLLTERNKYYDVNEIQYISPEVLSGKEYDKQADIWSLACLLYFIETEGSAPFDGKDINEVVSNMQNEIFKKFNNKIINDLLEHCFSKNTNNRYDCKAFQKKCFELYGMNEKSQIISVLDGYHVLNNKQLDFSETFVDWRGLEIITAEFFNTSNLEVLDFSKTEIDDKCLRHLCLHFDLILSLKKLSLYWNHITDDGVMLLCKYLNKIKELEYLNISRNYVHDISTMELFKLIKDTSITTLYLKRNYIHDISIRELAENIPSNLEVLNLSNNSINGDNNLLYFLGRMENLRELYLGKNKINDSISTDLFFKICNCKKLEKLFINNNDISYKNIESGIKIITLECKNLKYLGIKQNTMTDEEYKRIIKQNLDKEIVFTSYEKSKEPDYPPDQLDFDDDHCKQKEETDEVEEHSEETKRKMEIKINFNIDKDELYEKLHHIDKEEVVNTGYPNEMEIKRPVKPYHDSPPSAPSQSTPDDSNPDVKIDSSTNKLIIGIPNEMEIKRPVKPYHDSPPSTPSQSTPDNSHNNPSPITSATTSPKPDSTPDTNVNIIVELTNK